MASESLDLCGFPESTVEMKDARERALTPLSFPFHIPAHNPVEMKDARERALTQSKDCLYTVADSVEMQDARARALSDFC